jgi:hypothetical protein
MVRTMVHVYHTMVWSVRYSSPMAVPWQRICVALHGHTIGTKWYHGTFAILPRYICTREHYLKNDLKYKHSGATGKLVGVVSIEDTTVCYILLYYGSNSTAMSAARISTTILASMWACTVFTCTMVWSYAIHMCAYHLVLLYQ